MGAVATRKNYKSLIHNNRCVTSVIPKAKRIDTINQCLNDSYSEKSAVNEVARVNDWCTTTPR